MLYQKNKTASRIIGCLVVGVVEPRRDVLRKVVDDGEHLNNDHDWDPHEPGDAEDSRHSVQDLGQRGDAGTADVAARKPPDREEEETDDQEDGRAALSKRDGEGGGIERETDAQTGQTKTAVIRPSARMNVTKHRLSHAAGVKHLQLHHRRSCSAQRQSEWLAGRWAPAGTRRSRRAATVRRWWWWWSRWPS